ncbi:MAG TPA: RNA polymerase sigma factor [Anaeromyxobacteraceae bacterium]|nr:RNA polymerase sigma factor [Anaeromyxobacteraceae bacterium]
MDDGDVMARDGQPLERVLLAQHDRFLAFVAGRLGSRAEAEEVLQAAYQRALERGVPATADEGVVAWFYRVLRNALVDAARRRDAERRGVERWVEERAESVDPELEQAVCACIHDVLPALKPEYAQVVREVDLGQRPVAEVAAAQAITANNAAVRLHRGRQALKKQLLRTCGACAAHGCLDCQCKTHRSGA